MFQVFIEEYLNNLISTIMSFSSAEKEKITEYSS